MRPLAIARIVQVNVDGCSRRREAEALQLLIDEGRLVDTKGVPRAPSADEQRVLDRIDEPRNRVIVTLSVVASDGDFREESPLIAVELPQDDDAATATARSSYLSFAVLPGMSAREAAKGHYVKTLHDSKGDVNEALFLAAKAWAETHHGWVLEDERCHIPVYG